LFVAKILASSGLVFVDLARFALANKQINKEGGMSLLRKATEEPFKATLRKLYKLIHPDRFGRNLQVKQVNEHAVQTLNQMLAEWRRPSDSAMPHSFPFACYVPDTAAENQLRYISMDLRLHPPYHPGSAALKRVFEAVGLADDFAAESRSHSTIHLDSDVFGFLKDAVRSIQDFRDASRRCNEVCDRIMSGFGLDSYVFSSVLPITLCMLTPVMQNSVFTHLERRRYLAVRRALFASFGSATATTSVHAWLVLGV
jgi:hypothetical protein